MPQQIEVDDDVFSLLKDNAEPFVDTPNSTLRRLLGMDANGRVEGAGPAIANHVNGADPDAGVTSNSRRKESKTAQPVAKRGTLLPEAEYEMPLLRYLVEHDRAPSKEVIEAIGRELEGVLTPDDKKPLASGDIRWKNRAAFVRLRLVERGELDGHAPRGTWQITDKGRARVAAA